MSTVKTLRLKVKREAYVWLNAAAVEVNQVWNWANETSTKAARPFYGKPRWLTGFDLNNLSAGASACFAKLNANAIQRVNGEFAAKRRQFHKARLRWRVSAGSRRSLGWVPFKSCDLKRKGRSLRFAGKAFRVFEPDRLDGVKWLQGCFAQDALGDWWLCLPVQASAQQSVAPLEAVGIDLGLKAIATTSDGEVLEAGRWTHGMADKLANAQRHGHKRQAKRFHRKAANQRKDALHKFSTGIVRRYQKIVVGNVSSTQLVKTRMAKSVLDSGWGMLKSFLDYKSQQAARSFQVVNESYTSVTCSSCGCLSWPRGLNGLAVRRWDCGDCGASHERDVNSARNILRRAEVSASMSGNELEPKRKTA